MAEPAGPFIQVATVYDQSQLALLLSLFEDAGIWVQPASYFHCSVEWDWTIALGGMELRVCRSEAEAARTLLGRLEPLKLGRPIFSENRWIEALLILALFGLSLFAPPARIHASFHLDRPAAAQRRA